MNGLNQLLQEQSGPFAPHFVPSHLAATIKLHT